MDRFVLPWGRRRTTPSPFSPHQFLTFRVRSRPRSSSPYSKTKVGGSHVVAYRFGLKDVLAPPTLVPNAPSPELGRYMTRWPSFCLSISLSISLQCCRFLPPGCGVLGVRGLERNERRYVVSHLPPRMADGGGRSQRRPSGPLPPALLRPPRPTPLAFASVATVELFLGKFNVRKCSKSFSTR